VLILGLLSDSSMMLTRAERGEFDVYSCAGR
jgi:hypothetical protein